MVGPVTTLRELAARHMIIEAKCRRCDNSVKLWAGHLAGFYRLDSTINDLPFRCERCDSRDVDRFAYPHEKTEEVVVWKPVRMKISK